MTDGAVTPVTERDAEVARLRGRVAELERERDKYHLALQSLTPGGSEFYGDAERCVRYVREREKHEWEAIKRFKRERDAAEAKLQRAEAVVVAAETALTMVRDRIAFHERDKQGRWHGWPSENAHSQVVGALDSITAWRQQP